MSPLTKAGDASTVNVDVVGMAVKYAILGVPTVTEYTLTVQYGG
jgi:hypothetical protein